MLGRPFDYVKLAHDLSPTSSVFMLMPGAYDDTDKYGMITLDKPGRCFCNIGLAKIR